jgi:hypothetical protein
VKEAPLPKSKHTPHGHAWNWLRECSKTPKPHPSSKQRTALIKTWFRQKPENSNGNRRKSNNEYLMPSSVRSQIKKPGP